MFHYQSLLQKRKKYFSQALSRCQQQTPVKTTYSRSSEKYTSERTEIPCEKVWNYYNKPYLLQNKDIFPETSIAGQLVMDTALPESADRYFLIGALSL